MAKDTQNLKSRLLSTALWILAVGIMFSAAAHQERTGPTKEFRGVFRIGGQEHAYALVRSGNTDAPAPVVVPDPGPEVTGTVYFKRYPTADPFRPIPMERVAGDLQALLPVQPAAGKVEYYVVLEGPEGVVRIPEGEETLILRYKDPVPLGFLVPHVLCMFVGLLVGVRAALGALFQPAGMRRLAWTSLFLLTVGGMILGPIVQKYAFGAFWTGWPFGHDLTDNKTLIMWLVWVVAGVVVWRRPSHPDLWTRGAVLLAGVIMLGVYLIPHSLRGSELDYSTLESSPLNEVPR